MSATLYDHAKESFLSQNPSIDLDSDTIKLALVDLTADYTFNAAHQFKSSVPSYPGTTDQALTGRTITSGLFDSVAALFAAVAVSGTKTVGALVIYKDTGTAATSPVIEYLDGWTPIVPNGGDISAGNNGGANRWFKL